MPLPMNQAQVHEADDRFRSLLQKAVRRGHAQLVFTVSSLLESVGPKEKNWLRKRAVIITLEECWPLGAELLFNKRFHSKVAALFRAACSRKHKDAAALAALALAFSQGDRTVLEGGAEDRTVRLLAHAARRPEDFWKWIRSQSLGAGPRSLLDPVFRFRHVGKPSERIFAQAAAYLAATNGLPAPEDSQPPPQDFPYWIALDHHTRQGRFALKTIARDLHIDIPQLEWAFFHFASGVLHDPVPSFWWDRYVRWRFAQVGIPQEEAHLLWEPAVQQLKEVLAEDTHRLHTEVYRWKMKNRERIESLQTKVRLFIEKREKLGKGQRPLF
jgi:hypothetical protein